MIKIVVTDACIFIDLYDLELVSSFFNLEFEIHTTSAVYYELYIEQQEVLTAYKLDDRMVIHNLKEADFNEIHATLYPISLSEADKSVLHIANKLNACVLSSDKVVRNCAKNKDIEYHGMIWIFDQLVDSGTIPKQEAAAKLKQLVQTNFIFQNNEPLVSEINKRLILWS